MLALHPEVELRLYEECLEILGSRLPTHSDVSKLRYMEAFIWETMRLMPPCHSVGRCASQDMKLGSWDMPAGTIVLRCGPTEFDPERWLPGRSSIPHVDNDSHWPFGGGPWNCIGMGFDGTNSGSCHSCPLVQGRDTTGRSVTKTSGDDNPETRKRSAVASVQEKTNAQPRRYPLAEIPSKELQKALPEVGCRSTITIS